ncbi:type-F conjugative transfer system protein TraW [Pectobacterium brasiliense]|uniref:type-F conjugative transfer system protein TraW n=1 Tax=Pectobacterium brasiliense TaxID=180957 RepID=UPI00196939CB|nr:type-F conjugative transfer system protein TraW [Pectobacterium brasiliense]MBN3262957.1 type-F conjugative transfer system protein TraW [Pectobacterium brasiliense]
MKYIYPAIYFTLIFSTNVFAKDFGTYGHLYQPAEQDMLAFIENRLKSMEQTGELDRLKDEAIERVKRNAVRPAPVIGLMPATTYRTFNFDPSMTVANDITDMKGNVIARKGDKVNPLDKVPYSTTLYFIDADDKDQLAWVKKEILGKVNFKVILVKGNIKDASDALDEQIYFDQSGTLTDKFGFKSVPVKISRDGHFLKVEEIPATGEKNE